MSITYGSTPGTQVTVEGGVVSGVTLGEEEKIVIFANGDPSVGSESAATPVQVESKTEVENAFGENADVVDVFEDVVSNGGNAQAGYVYVVVPATTQVSGEVHNGTQVFTLANAPIIEDASTISITDTVDSTTLDVEPRYEKTPNPPTDADTAYYNPYSGDVNTDSSSDYSVDYEYLEWADAFDAADGVVLEDESAVYAVNTPTESVLSDAFAKAESLRDPDYKMVKVVGGAQPNASTSGATPAPMYDINSYTDSLDSLPGFAAVPAVQNDSTLTNVGAIAGKMAGNPLTNPVRGEELEDVTIETGISNEGRFTYANRVEARSKFLMPLKGGDDPVLDGSLSTYEGATWETDIQTVRVLDRAVLLIKGIADEYMNSLDTEGRDELAAQAAQSELEALATDGLLESNTSEETNLFVRPASSSQGEIALEAGLTPVEAVETFTVEITVG